MSHNQQGMKDTLRDGRVDWPTMEGHHGTSGPASSPTNNITVVRFIDWTMSYELKKPFRVGIVVHLQSGLLCAKYKVKFLVI